MLADTCQPTYAGISVLLASQTNSTAIYSDSWSIVFGDDSILGKKSAVAVYGDGFRVERRLNCDDADGWDSYTDGGLPYSVEVHPGNACKDPSIGGDDYDNVWIEYSNQFIDLPNDTRCSKVYNMNKGRRCIVPLEP